MGNRKQISRKVGRREALRTMGGSLMLTAVPTESRANGGPGGTVATPPYDVLIKGGRVLDPSQEMDQIADVAIRAGKIARASPGIPVTEARQVVRAKGRIVTPGLIDLHVHCFPFGPYGIDPDSHLITRGVTTAVDAGTAGALTLPAFRHYVVEKAATRVRALLHIVAIGMVAGSTSNMGELEDLRYCDPKLAVQAARKNADLVLGFKIRFSRQYTGPHDYEGMKRTRAAADEAGLPMMVHIGNSYSPLPLFLELMRKGDVLTHSFTGHPEGLLDSQGRLRPEVLTARERGVIFDVGHGAGSFSFSVMEKCLAQGFSPDTISSDLYSANVNGPVYDLTTTLSKFLLLGLSLTEVIDRVTWRAAGVFMFGATIGTLKPGAEADVSILELRHGDFAFTDSYGQVRQGSQKIFPVATVRGGKLFHPAAG